jgi:hypothetical protein
MLTVVADGRPDDGSAAGAESLIDEIVREAARRILTEALPAQVDAYDAPRMVALPRPGAFRSGALAERPEQAAA